MRAVRLAPGVVLSPADQVREKLYALRMSQREAARVLGINDRTMRYYCSGSNPVPPIVMLALDMLIQLRVLDEGHYYPKAKRGNPAAPTRR
jgi:hypothetical protein